MTDEEKDRKKEEGHAGCGGHHEHGEGKEHTCCGGHHAHGEEEGHAGCGGHHGHGEGKEHTCCGGHHAHGEEEGHAGCGGHHGHGEGKEHACCGGHHAHEEEEHAAFDGSRPSEDAEENDDFDTIILTLDDGSELECGVVDIFEFEEKTYIALVTLDEEQNVLLYAFHESEDSDEIEVTMIEDEAEFNRVAAEFDRMMAEEEEAEEEAEEEEVGEENAE